jgi:class 3 adenylate cyclase
VTVLFADLKGSMELLADRDPEEARKILDPVLERMMEAVHRYEGTVNQVMGDGIMALFGAPLAHEDHAVRACYAALRMQDVVKRYAEDVRRAEGVPIQIRVGLNAGEVVVRSIGGDLKMDYTAVGQTTHLAARMEQLATPGSILMTAEALRLAEGYVEVKPLGPVNVKGVGGPLEVYEVTGAGPVRTRLQASAARGLTRFVGRDAEVEQLRNAQGQARAGRGQVVAVVGEPGVGKSRLFWEFARSHRVDGCLVLEAASVSYGKATTYLPIIGLLRMYFQIEPGDDARKIQEKVIGKVLSLDRALEPAVPALLALLDVPAADETWTRLDPPQRRQRTMEGIKRLLLRESQVQPLIVIFEDLHWIDGETQAVLEGLVESLPTARMVLLVNYRPEYRHAWGGKTYYGQLRIDPLPAASADELLHHLLGGDPSLDPLKRFLVERTDGNPLFLEENVRTLVETHVLAGGRGAHRLAKPLENIQIPATVQAVLAARIDRLPPEEKGLLQTAAVIGKDVPFVLLQATAGLEEDALRRGLAHLGGVEFLYETRLFPDVEYTFKHALTYEVAYASLLQARRRELHARILEAIEQHRADRLAEHVERLAYHAVRAEAWEKAITCLRQAGDKAMLRSAYRAAAEYFEQALDALRHLPSGLTHSSRRST